MIDLLHCTFEPLHEDGELILYRAVHASPADGVVPSVLVVGPAGEYVSPATLARLEHEYALAAELDPRWAVRPLGLERYRGRPVLVLEDLGGEPLARLLGTPMEVGAFLRLAISAARAVGRLHAAGLIHKDIKPANTLFNSVTGDVGLTGFGIASRLRRERQSPEPPEIIAGTLAYMAPEQTGRMEQPPVPELPLQDAQRRFQLVFRRFIGVFARPEHPLAPFLDDLQWLDAATLDLLEDLLIQSDLPHLMLIGAYRDNEVTATHPLKRNLDAVKAAGGKVAEITLAPLAREHLGQLMADALRCEPERAAPLAHLVHEKTGGNPFFAIQFISALADERMLTFDHDAARWSWDLDRIHGKGYADNVVDLMVGKLKRLPAETQQALQQLACLGNIAEVTTLSIVLGTSEEQVHAHLCEAIRQELIQRLESAYGSLTTVFRKLPIQCSRTIRAPRPVFGSADCSRRTRRRSSGDLLISAIGAAPWQIALVVALAMSVAVLPDGGAVIAIQAAIWAFLMVTLYLPSLASGDQPTGRWTDRGCDRAPARRRVPTELVSTPAVIVTGTRGALS